MSTSQEKIIAARSRGQNGGQDPSLSPERRYRLLLENVGQVIFQVDLDGRWIYLNPAWEKTTGFSSEESLGAPFTEYIHPDDLAESQTLFHSLLSGETETVETQIRLTREDGGFCWVDVFAKSIRAKDGTLLGVSGSFLDVTEPKQVDEELRMYQETLEEMVEMRTEELNAVNEQLQKEVEERKQIADRLRESEKLFRGSFENTPIGMALTTPKGQFSEVNASLCQILGYSKQELEGKTFQTITHPEDLDKSVGYLRQLLAGELDTFEDEKRYLRKDGTPVYCQLNVSALRDEEGNIRHFITQIQDITERRQSERQTQLRLAVSQALAVAQTEEEVVASIVEKATYYPDGGISVFLRQEEDDTLLLRGRNPLASDLEPLPVGTQVPIERLAPLVAANETFVSDNIMEDARAPQMARNMAQEVGIVSWATFPLTAGGEWLGTLMVASQNEGAFGEDLLVTYRTLAEQSAATLRAIRLYEETQQSLERRSREVALSTQVAQEIATATELQELYDRVVTEVKEQFGYYYAQLLRYDPATDVVALVAGYGEPGAQMLEEGHQLRRGEGIIGQSVQTGRPVLRPTVADDPTWQPNPLLPDTAGELAVPIKLKDEILGVLDVQSTRPGELSEADQLVLEGLCGQIATAIESTRLQQEREKQLEEMSSLQRLMSREAWLSYQASRPSDPAGYLFDQKEIQPLRDDGQRGNGQSAPQPTEHLPVPQEQEKATPLTIRGEVIGKLGVQENPASPLSEDEEALLESISRQVAEALENARLLDQTQKRAVELETVARVSATTSTILESDKLLKAVVELTKRSFNLYHAHIYLLDEKSGNLVLAAGAGDAGDIMVEEGWHIALQQEQSLVAQAARQRDAITVGDVRQEPGFLPNPMLPETRSEMAVPMIATNRLLGVLDIQAATTNAFTEEDARIYTTLASQVAIALQNASLYEEQLETARQLRELDRLKTEFLASMSHELRTPLNSIIGFADVLLEGLDGELSPRMEEDVRLIRNSGQHLRELIGDILDMSKIEAGMMDLRYEPVDVTEMVPDIEAFAKTQLMTHDKELDFDLEIEPEVDTVYADRTRFRQVLYNLISNAIKFTAEGSVTTTMEITGDDMLLVKVEDTGIGIKEENVPIIFEQFRQVDGSLTRTAGGTGLGLPITKSLVELHGGEIGVETEPGEGSTFWFTIPKERPVRKPGTGPLSR